MYGVPDAAVFDAAGPSLPQQVNFEAVRLAHRSGAEGMLVEKAWIVADVPIVLIVSCISFFAT